MPDKRSATFRVNDGTISPAAQDWVDRALAQYDDGDPVKYTIEPKKHSDAHRRYYFGQVITPVLRAWQQGGIMDLWIMGPSGEPIKLPLTKEFVHEFFKAKYMAQVDPQQIEENKRLSIKPLNDTQLSAFIELIRSDQDVLDAGVFIEEERIL